MQDGVPPQRVRGGRSECAGDVMRDFRPRDRDCKISIENKTKKISRYWGSGLGLSSLGVGVLEIHQGVFGLMSQLAEEMFAHIVEAPTFTCLFYILLSPVSLARLIMDGSWMSVWGLLSGSVLSTPKQAPRKHLPRGRTCKDETGTAVAPNMDPVMMARGPSTQEPHKNGAQALSGCTLSQLEALSCASRGPACLSLHCH